MAITLERPARPREASAPARGDEAARPAPAGTLEAQGVRKSYGKRLVLDDVSFDVKPGEAVALLGPNGAGKTTSFYIVVGLIAAEGGRVLLDGVDVTRTPMHRRARLGVGYLPQEASIFRGLTVGGNIQAALETAIRSKPERKRMMDELLDEFGLTSLRDAPAVTLSGGERRRAEIARALATKPRYVLLDEPLAGIDPINVAEIRGLTLHLKERGIGVLITDHNVRDTLAMVDRAYILAGGKVLREGTPAEIVADPEVRRVYLGNSFGPDDAGLDAGGR